MADEMTQAPAIESPVSENAPVEAPASNDAPVSVESIEASAPEQTYQQQAPAFDMNAFARANAESLRPILAQYAPKPQAAPNPWDDPNKFWTLPQGPEANQIFHDRLNQVVEARVKAALEQQEQRFSQVLQGRDAYFKQTFAVDPNFQRIQSHFEKYVAKGYHPEDAKRLAAMDAGMNGQAAAPARSMPAAPRHLTTQAARSVGGAPLKAQGDFKNEAVRESRFKALAAKHGWES